MMYDIQAKNLLLNKICHNCNHAGSLTSLKAFHQIEDNKFFEYIGIHKKDVCIESNYLGTIFYCDKIKYTLPRELTCEHWEKEKE